MRISKTMLVFILIIVVFPAAAAETEKPWFDMDNCAFCKCLTDKPGLIDNMSWEYHDLSNGLLSITIVAPEYKEPYLKAQKDMEKIALEMSLGQTDITTCGHCDAYGKLMMAGAHLELVDAKVGYILLIASDRPGIQKMIWEFGRRNREQPAH